MHHIFHRPHEHTHRTNFDVTKIKMMPPLRKWIKKCFTNSQNAL